MPSQYQRIQTTLDTIIDLLNSDRLAELTNFFEFPFVMQMENRLVVFQTPDKAVAAWRAFRRDLICMGCVRSRAKVTATELARNGRFRVWADMEHIDRTNSIAAAAQMVLFCHQTAEGIRLEMEHVTKTALNDRWTAAGNLGSLG